MKRKSFASTYRKLIRHANVKYAGVLIWGACSILLIVLDLLNMILLGYISQIAASKQVAVMTKHISIISCIFVARLAFAWVGAWSRGVYRERVMENFRICTMQSLVEAKLSWMRQQSTGDMLERFGTNLYNATEMLSGEFLDLVDNVLKTVISAVLMFYISWEVALAYFAAYPLILFLQVRTSKSAGKHYQSTFKSRGEFMGLCQNYIQNTELIQAYNYSNRAQTNAADQYAKYEYSYKKTWRLGIPGMVACMVFTLIPVLSFAWAGYVQYRSGSVDVSALFTLMMITISLYGVMSGLYDRILHIRERLASCERLIAIWEAPQEKKKGAMVEHLSEETVLSFDHVSFSYNGKENVIEDISFSIRKQEHIAIVGESGCGKSTLLRMILRLDEPTGGTIGWNGKNVSEYALDAYRAQFAYVPQDSFIFSGSIWENLQYGKKDASERDMMDACKAAMIWEKIEQLDHGLHTTLSEGGQTLSGGERQRLTIARALISNADIILLDEPTAALDNMTSESVMEQLLKNAKDRTVLVVTHALKSWKDIDRVLVISNGRIVEVGRPDDLMAKDHGYLRKMALSQPNDGGTPS